MTTPVTPLSKRTRVGRPVVDRSVASESGAANAANGLLPLCSSAGKYPCNYDLLDYTMVLPDESLQCVRVAVSVRPGEGRFCLPVDWGC